MSHDGQILEGATAPVFTDTELTILRAAQTLLAEARQRVPMTYSGGITARQCTVAADAVRNSLVAVEVWLEQPTTLVKA